MKNDLIVPWLMFVLLVVVTWKWTSSESEHRKADEVHRQMQAAFCKLQDSYAVETTDGFVVCEGLGIIP